MSHRADEVVARRGRQLLLLTAGSRGDVEPFLALAREASRRGHEVVVAATSSMTAGLGPQPFEVAVLGGDLGVLVAAQGVSPLAALRSWRSAVHPALRALLASAVATALEVRPDVIVAHPKVASAPIAAAVLDVPHVLVETVPTLTPTGDFPAAGIASRDLGRSLNRLTYRATAGATTVLGPDLRRIRAGHGVPRTAPLPPPAAVLCPVSPALVARPSDWPATAHLTGAWHESTGTGPDAEVDGFLAAAESDGAPVVVAGFGSMATGAAAAAARSRAVVRAARTVGARVLVVTGWGGLDAAAAREAAAGGHDVMVVPAIPHASVLPRAHVVVHHGGAGTVHAVARAGAVSVVVPFIADQPWWATRLHHQGLSPTPLPARQLTAERLAHRLTTAARHRRAARSTAEAMTGEQGTKIALDILEQLT